MKKIMISGVVLVFLEIALFILIGQAIGVFNTLLLIILSSILGIYVAKKKGVKSFQDVKNSLQSGAPPGVAMIDTMMIFLGGILLVTPGFLTDLIGLLMLFSLTRKLFKPAIYMWIKRKMKNGKFVVIQR